MTSAVLQNLEKLLGTPRDGALLRYSLGTEYLKANQPARAAEQFAAAVERDPAYSAAWKMLGKAFSECGRHAEAVDAWQQGIKVAEARGDVQAAKEMSVFARRVAKQLPGRG